MLTRQIPVEQLKIGMFIDEMDVSWVKSPFLRHKRKITEPNDILLLKQAGVKFVSIDLQKGIDVWQTAEVASLSQQAIPKQPAAPEIKLKPTSASAENTNESLVSIEQEMINARKIQSEIKLLIKNLSLIVKQGKKISIQAFSPVINECISSLKRNDQAFLMLLYLPRPHAKLEEHGSSVLSLVLSLALAMELNEKDTQTLGMAALLHDCGWAKLPLNLFGNKKPYTSTEKRLVKQHIAIAENVLLKNPEIPDQVKDLVIHHHEPNDAKGYPKNLKTHTNDSMLEILQACDTYDEMLHGLQDKPGVLPANALKAIYQDAQKGHYTDKLVACLLEIVGVYPLTSSVVLKSGEKARVIEINRQDKLSPKIKIYFDATGKRYQSPIIIDLTQENTSDRKIVSVISTLPDIEESPF